MRYRLSTAWEGAPAGTIIDSASDDQWPIRARELTIPIDATPLDAAAHEAQLKAYPDHRYLLRGGWEDK
jgi:hypothetical protein